MSSDQRSLELDFVALEAIRWFDMALSERICTASTADDAGVLEVLRTGATKQLAEFLFGLKMRNICRPEQIEALARLHNDYVVGLTKDKAKMARLGLRADRMHEAIFTADVLPRLVEGWAGQPGAIDQSNLARFLATTMSTETCRKVTVACSKGGFLARRRSPYGTMLVISVGTLETIYGETLHQFRRKLTEGLKEDLRHA